MEQQQILPPYAIHTRTSTSVLMLLTQFMAVLCIFSFYGYMRIDGELCYLTYKGTIRCQFKNLGQIDSNQCAKPFQCNVIKAGYPITIILMVFVGLNMVLNCVKYKQFPLYIYKSYLISLGLQGSSMIMIFVIGFMLLISDFGMNDLNIWIIMMQSFGIPACLISSVCLLRQETIKSTYQMAIPIPQTDYVQMQNQGLNQGLNL